MDSDESAGGDDDDVSADEDEERDDDNDEVKQPKLGKTRSKEMLQQEEPDEATYIHVPLCDVCAPT